MKSKKQILILGVIAVLLSSCGARKATQVVEIGCDAFNQETFITDNITAKSGEEITLKLCSNPSTGFQWSEFPTNSNPEILSQSTHDYLVHGENGSPLPPGTPGYEIWTFTAKEPGLVQLYFEYSRNWEEGEKGIWIYTLEINVE